MADMKIISYSPTDDARDVPVNATFTVTFDAPLAQGSGWIYLKKGGSIYRKYQVGTPEVVVGGNTLTIKPFVALDKNTAFNWQLSSGIIKGFSGDLSYNFTTGSRFAPTDADRYQWLKANALNPVAAHIVTSPVTNWDRLIDAELL